MTESIVRRSVPGGTITSIGLQRSPVIWTREDREMFKVAGGQSTGEPDMGAVTHDLAALLMPHQSQGRGDDDLVLCLCGEKYDHWAKHLAAVVADYGSQNLKRAERAEAAITKALAATKQGNLMTPRWVIEPLAAYQNGTDTE